jgi:hypothetical protein
MKIDFHGYSSLLSEQHVSINIFMPSSTELAPNRADRTNGGTFMISDIAFLEQIFGRMQEAGLVETKSDFSQRLLGKGASYLTSMAARERNVPMEVLDQMSAQLFDRVMVANSAIADMEATLSQMMAHAHREAEIRNQFEEHRRRRLAAELSGLDDTSVNDEPAPTTSRFVQMMLRKTGLLKGAASGQGMSPRHRTLH